MHCMFGLRPHAFPRDFHKPPRFAGDLITILLKAMVLLIKICSNFCGYFQANEHDRNTRNKSIFVRLPKVELEYNRHAFRFAGAKIYNELPVRIRFKTFSRTTL